MYHGGQHQMRAAHADRERAADVLRAGFVEGRLTQEEYEQRVDRALRAVTYGELEMLTGDLPRGVTSWPVPSHPVPAHPVPAHPVPAQPVPQTFLPPPKPTETNNTAIAAMACGLCTLFTAGITAVPAIVLGHKARSEMRRTGEPGEGYATTGLVFGYLSVAFWAIAIGGLMVFGIVHGATSATPQPPPASYLDLGHGWEGDGVGAAVGGASHETIG